MATLSRRVFVSDHYKKVWDSFSVYAIVPINHRIRRKNDANVTFTTVHFFAYTLN